MKNESSIANYLIKIIEKLINILQLYLKKNCLIQILEFVSVNYKDVYDDFMSYVALTGFRTHRSKNYVYIDIAHY